MGRLAVGWALSGSVWSFAGVTYMCILGWVVASGMIKPPADFSSIIGLGSKGTK